MHEINTAAETITSAADPEANIIFGATINPDLDGEIIITVVATGFDDSYFTNRKITTGIASRSSKAPVKKDDDKKTVINKSEDSVMGNLDMDLDDSDADNDFHSDDDGPNMWTMDDKEEDNSDTDKPEVDQEEPKDETSDSPRVINDAIEDENEVEKQPSFLRRLKNRRKSNQEDENQDH
jgi:hypothetical protein